VDSVAQRLVALLHPAAEHQVVVTAFSHPYVATGNNFAVRFWCIVLAA
jgi:hypothetical protein